MRIRAVAPEPMLFGHVSGRARGNFNQRTRQMACLIERALDLTESPNRTAFFCDVNPTHKLQYGTKALPYLQEL